MLRRRISQVIRAASTKTEVIFAAELTKLSQGEKLTQDVVKFEFDGRRDLFKKNRKTRVEAGPLGIDFDLLQSLERRGIVNNHWSLHEAKMISKWVNNHSRRILTVFDTSKEFNLRDAVSVNTLMLAGELGHKPVILIDDRSTLGRKTHRASLEKVLRPIARIYRNFLLKQWFPSSKRYNFPEFTIRLASECRAGFKINPKIGFRP